MNTFLAEFWERITSSAPKFFQILQAISAIVAGVSLALTQANVAVPDWLLWLKSTTTLVVTITTIVVAQLPKKDATQP